MLLESYMSGSEWEDVEIAEAVVRLELCQVEGVFLVRQHRGVPVSECR